MNGRNNDENDAGDQEESMNINRAAGDGGNKANEITGGVVAMAMASCEIIEEKRKGNEGGGKKVEESGGRENGVK